MKRTVTFMVAAALMGMFAFSGIGFAAKGGTQGPPDDSGEPPDLGDIIVLYRDDWGLPILTEDLCQQPLPSEECPTQCQVNGGLDDTTQVVAVDPLTCAAVASVTVGEGEVISCAGCTQEVDFGRTSVIRSPVSVIEQSLAEAVTKLATAQCTSLDPAGRLVNTSEIDGVVLSATIDSPLESLAIYWQLMLTGYLGAGTMPIDLPDPNVLNTAARGLGAAADKTGKVTVDQVVYTNEILGLTEEGVQTYLPKICMNVREEVQGAVQTVRKCFLNYGGEHTNPLYTSVGGTIADYQYDRTLNFSGDSEEVGNGLPNPAYIPADDPAEGWFEYLGLWSEPTGTDPYLFYIVQGPILESVFCLDADGEPVVPEDGDCLGIAGSIDTGFVGGNVGGFTQAADDAREVIEFTHDRPLPLGYETPVPLCGDPTPLSYDLTFPEQSGFQVPKNYVNGGEREFFVTVSNAAGTTAASGTLYVLAQDSGLVDLGYWEFPFSDLPVGQTVPFTALFTITTTSPTIEWTATVVGDGPGVDLNPENNTREATSTIKATGGGGGGGGGGGQ